MEIPLAKIAGTMFMCARRLLFTFCVALIGLSLARGQSSVPPLPPLPVTFVFSNCEAGVTYRATITDWLRDANGNVDPLAAIKIVQPSTGTVSYTYLFWGSFSMTVGQTTQIATGARLPDGSTGRPLGSLSVLYTNLGVSGVPPSTTFTLQSSNANGLGVGTGQATSNLAWSATLYGPGDLMPNGVASPLPPISAWTPINTYIQGDGRLLARPITRYGACPAASGKSLGDPNCHCGDPINVGTGNLFEEVTDYQTAGTNKLGFTRYYNSLAKTDTLATTLGANWRSTYDRHLRIVPASSAIAERADGQDVSFALTAGNWTTDTDLDFKLTQTGTTWTLTDPNDNVETYRAIGATQAHLETVRARNGYTLTLQYNATNQLITVTDSFRRQLSFTYSNGLLQTVATPDGLTFTYGYGAITGGNRLTSVAYSTSPVTRQTYLYETTALPTALTGIIDENGNRYTTWTYDGTGRALSSQHAGGADLTSISYNDSDGSRTVTSPLGSQVVYKFTTLQGVPKVTQIDRLATATTAAASIKFTYDSNGYMASQTDWNGNLTTYGNAGHGLPLRIIEAAGTPLARTTTITYHATFRLPLTITEPGTATTLTYDTGGNLLTRTITDTTTTTVPYATRGTARTWTYTWANSLLASVKGPRADVDDVTRFAYDSNGALTTITNALGQIIRLPRSLPGGLPQTIVDANGVTSELTYDGRLRLATRTLVTAAGPLTTSYRYDAAGNLTGVTRPDGSTLTHTYDAAHRLTAVKDLFNQSIAYTLDALGNRTQTRVRDAGGRQQRARMGNLDELGRLRQSTGGASQSTSYTYDANGNIVTITDPLGRVKQQAFDVLNHLITITDPAKGVSTATYDARDRAISFTDPNGGTTSLVRNGFGQVIQQISPDSGATVYRYDLNGNLTQRVDASGATTNYAYDALHRMTSVTYPGDAGQNVTYTYDEPDRGFGIGRLTGVKDAAGALSRSFDENGNLLSETRSNGGVTLTTTYAYDAASRVVSIRYPAGWMVAYARDAMGRTTAITAQAPSGGDPIAIASGIGYQALGPVSALTFGNGVVESRTFDADYRLTSLTDTGASVLQNLTYSYDKANNVLSIQDAVNDGNSQSFGYDALDRLTGAQGAYGDLGYTYDSVGNRLTQSRGGSAITYSYTAGSNQLVSVSSGDARQTISHTKAGNIEIFNPGAGAVMNLSYNQAGRLTAVTAGDNVMARYTYDAFGRRLIKAGAATTLYQYDGSGHLLEEADDQGNALVDYVYLADLPVATISPGGGQVYFLHTDRQGTPRLATDSSQAVVWAGNYGPFGEMSTIPALIVQNLRMPGQEFDVDTGLYHNGVRDYVPGWGRYLQSDPIGLEGGVNTYAYANANPIKIVDPSGSCGLPCVFMLLAALASVVNDTLGYYPTLDELLEEHSSEPWLSQYTKEDLQQYIDNYAKNYKPHACTKDRPYDSNFDSDQIVTALDHWPTPEPDFETDPHIDPDEPTIPRPRIVPRPKSPRPPTPRQAPRVLYP